LEDVFEKIVCPLEERPQHWNTEQFWKTYDAIQSYKDFRLGPESDQSLETKARLNLDFLISNREEALWQYKNFLRMLKEDILSFGTLPDYTLRRIAGFKVDKIDEIEQLKNELGEDYLTKEKNRQKEERKEIIIAIENQKV
jgi:hypothetical protein